jgi:protein-tyrosine-phosphatase
MTDLDIIPAGVADALSNVTRDLHHEFLGVFGEQTVHQLVVDSYRELASGATVQRWLIISTEKFARQRLEALVHSDTPSDGRVPSVLLLCVNNAGRSQMALGFVQELAGDHVVAWSAGSEPGQQINPMAVEAMAEVGIDISREFPKPWTDEFVLSADVVITMGCGDSCPLLPGKHYEDWELDDPAGKSLDEVRQLREDIRTRVEHLLTSLVPRE